MVKRRHSSEEVKGEMDNNLKTQGTWLPPELLFKIFLLLPAKALCKLRCVSKTFLTMINSSTFVEAHFLQSETVLITRKSFLQNYKPSPFPLPSDKPPECYFHSWKLHNSKCQKVRMPDLRDLECILASCNGLILARVKKNGGVLVINPSSWNHIRLPLGTIGFIGCYAFMFSHLTGGYKVIHLFRDEFRHIRCEILNLSTRSWHAVDGPNSVQFESFTTHRPVSAAGAIYWLPQIDNSSHIICLGFHDEKFFIVPLPISSTKNDRLVEITGSLSFVTHASLNLIQVWILKRDDSKEIWMKRYSINSMYDTTEFVPVCASLGKMYFKRREFTLLHIYDFETEEMEGNFEDDKRDDDDQGEVLEMDNGTNDKLQLYMPHVQSLVSWDGNHVPWDV